MKMVTFETGRNLKPTAGQHPAHHSKGNKMDKILVNGFIVDANDYQAQSWETYVRDGSIAKNGEDLTDQFRAAAKFHWAAAGLALIKNDFALMRTNAQQAQDAEQLASPDGKLLSAIFGAAKAPQDRIVEQGAALSDSTIKNVREKVLAEIAAHKSRMAVKNAKPAREEKAVVTATSETRKTVQNFVRSNQGLGIAVLVSELEKMGIDRAHITVKAMARDNQLKIDRRDAVTA